MAPDPNLGLYCPGGGALHVCLHTRVRFVGCCMYDPCDDGSGHCRADSVRPTGYNPTNQYMIQPQQCEVARDSAGANMSWWRCDDGEPPYFSCCSRDICQERTCSIDHIAATILSDDPIAAAPFIGDDNLADGMANWNTTCSCPPAVNATNLHPGVEKTYRDIEIAIPVAAGVVIIIMLFIYYRVIKTRKAGSKVQATEALSTEMGNLQRPFSEPNTTFQNPRPAPTPTLSVPPVPRLPPYPGSRPDHSASSSTSVKGKALDSSQWSLPTRSIPRSEAWSPERHRYGGL
ncbi:hypothetical protein F4861DRAFT_547717 [Xylaria intraflava]|nr:hypothetical protein F4861DRAFT_547717 [Xylaria intraflava]